jgi:hypothetical protein
MIKCGHCGNLHPTVAAVKTCSLTPNVPSALRRGFTEEDERDMQRMEAQAYSQESRRDAAAKVAKWDRETALNDLLHEANELLCTKDIPTRDVVWSRALRQYLSGQSGTITEHGLRTAIARLQGYRNVRAGGYGDERRPVEVEGLYRLGGRLYQVVRGKDSGKLYAKLVIFPPADSQSKRPTLTYAKGVIFELTPDHLVPVEEAQDITRKTGWCTFGHFLTNPVSIKRGMGPVCWARYGAPAKAKASAA